jgi:hypothetical protein
MNIQKIKKSLYIILKVLFCAFIVFCLFTDYYGLFLQTWVPFILWLFIDAAFLYVIMWYLVE